MGVEIVSASSSAASVTTSLESLKSLPSVSSLASFTSFPEILSFDLCVKEIVIGVVWVRLLFVSVTVAMNGGIRVLQGIRILGLAVVIPVRPVSVEIIRKPSTSASSVESSSSALEIVATKGIIAFVISEVASAASIASSVAAPASSSSLRKSLLLQSGVGDVVEEVGVLVVLGLLLILGLRRLALLAVVQRGLAEFKLVSIPLLQRLVRVFAQFADDPWLLLVVALEAWFVGLPGFILVVDLFVLLGLVDLRSSLPSCVLLWLSLRLLGLCLVLDAAALDDGWIELRLFLNNVEILNEFDFELDLCNYV